ncbi:nucleoside-diphosphate kinase [Bacillus alkalicellulosilyticus]|uniref:nucleoside-diphosphate kinase n=1 Tax=Alkalihalobacterium alkalicellulosilyticum TaxID=1912214 RepID=UPI0009960602|nr:nucleoside-diphosphate kinase [Bacillus alkalicellulosilyticus]
MIIKDLISEKQKMVFDSDSLNYFVESAEDNIIDSLGELGLILLGPETFITSNVEKVLTLLEDRGFVFLRICVIDSFTKEQLAQFIPKSIANSFRWWLIQERYIMGPTAALMVCRDKKINEPILRELKRIKGYRIPLNAEESTLRNQLPTINGLLNFVHTPDNSAFLLRDSEPFFNTEDVIQAINEIEDIHLGHTRGLSINDIKEKYLNGYINENNLNYSFFSILFSLVHRIYSKILQLSKHSIRSIISLQNILTEALEKREQLVERIEQIQAIKNYTDELIIGYNKTKIDSFHNFFEEKDYIKAHILWDISYDLLSLKNSSKKDWITIFKKLEYCDVKIKNIEYLILISTFLNIEEEIQI